MGLNNVKLYFATLICFKLAVGAILLLIGWDALSFTGDPTRNVAAITALAFFPAAFSRPLFKLFISHDLGLLLKSSLFFCAGIVAIEPIIIKLNLNAFFAFHFFLWVLIFLIEVALEKWFVTLSKSTPSHNARKISGISTALIQVAIIVGPLAVAIAKKLEQNAPYYMVSIIFLAGALFANLLPRSRASSPNNNSEARAISNIGDFDASGLNAKLYVVAFALVWPTVAVFNMAAPIIARNVLVGTVDIAAILEAALAGSTAAAGFFYTWYSRRMSSTIRGRIAIVMLIVAFCFIFIGISLLWIVIFSIALIGLAYGYFRSASRVALSRHFDPDTAGLIIANANALSAPLVLLYLGIYVLEISTFGSTKHLMLPLSFLISGFVFWKLCKSAKESDL